jgi:hypothetical protein
MTTIKVIHGCLPPVVVGNLPGGADICLNNTVVSGQLDVVEGLKRTYQIVGFRRSRQYNWFVDNPSHDLLSKRPQYQQTFWRTNAILL